jgi:hypothetical protein
MTLRLSRSPGPPEAATSEQDEIGGDHDASEVDEQLKGGTARLVKTAEH